MREGGGKEYIPRGCESGRLLSGNIKLCNKLFQVYLKRGQKGPRHTRLDENYSNDR